MILYLWPIAVRGIHGYIGARRCPESLSEVGVVSGEPRDGHQSGSFLVRVRAPLLVVSHFYMIVRNDWNCDFGCHREFLFMNTTFWLFLVSAP